MQPEDYAYLYELEDRFWWFAGMRQITAALLNPVCPPSSDRIILDAGCGTGGMLSWLSRYAGNGKVFGIDLTPRALAYCRSRGQVVAQASITRLPFPDSTFDLLTSSDVLVQLPGEGSDESAIREMYRVLRPGGVIFVRVAAYQWLRSGHDEAQATQRRYYLSELIEKIKRGGFEILRATYANSTLLPIAMMRRLILQRIGLAQRGLEVKPWPRGLQWLNNPLKGTLQLEARLFKHPKARLPAGLSAICVAQKPRT